MISTVTLNPALDKTIYISKLAPNDTNRVTNVETDAGGKGINCSRMLQRLGVETAALAFLGGDTGDFIKMVVEKAGVALDYVQTDRPTRTCVAVEESANVPATTFNERGGPIEHKELVAMLEKVKDVSRRSKYMVFGGSVPTGVNQDVYRVMIEIAQAGGAKSVLDADGEALVEGLKAKPFMIKPNRDEAERLLGVQFESIADVARGALSLAERGIELVIISLGKQGAVACYEKVIYYAATPAVKVVSTIGSGDSLTAGILWALESGKTIQDALKAGCAAGAATAMSNGVDIGSKEDVDRLISEVKVTITEPAAKND
ncbi:MAG: 1-phosphofructokinase [Armatimonadota bacterium]|nr:1-phosphofructokinase [bacterium]